jgi:hypothetical protein
MKPMRRWLIVLLACAVTSASAQPSAGATGGNLYVAGAGFDFAAVADRALAQNPSSRFFLLAVGDAVRYLSLTAAPEMVEARNRVARSQVQFLVCQRDLDKGSYKIGDLVPGTVAVKGWPAPGSNDMPANSNYYPDENPADLPWSTETLRRLRATCSN